MRKTLVIGASPNPARYGYIATVMLSEYKHPVIPFGIRKGEIEGINIVNELPADTDIDTITLYLNPKNQEQYYEDVLRLHPKRVIFNPGTENRVFEQLLEEKGIETIEACTLVLLRTGQF